MKLKFSKAFNIIIIINVVIIIVLWIKIGHDLKPKNVSEFHNAATGENPNIDVTYIKGFTGVNIMGYDVDTDNVYLIEFMLEGIIVGGVRLTTEFELTFDGDKEKCSEVMRKVKGIHKEDFEIVKYRINRREE